MLTMGSSGLDPCAWVPALCLSEFMATCAAKGVNAPSIKTFDMSMHISGIMVHVACVVVDDLRQVRCLYSCRSNVCTFILPHSLLCSPPLHIVLPCQMSLDSVMLGRGCH